MKLELIQGAELIKAIKTPKACKRSMDWSGFLSAICGLGFMVLFITSILLFLKGAK